MLQFSIGLFVSAPIGLFITTVYVASKRGDKNV